MNKNLMLGFLGLFAVALVSAGVVSYLSNTKTIDMDIESPMAMKFNGETYADTATMDFGTVYGGEDITYKTWTKNFANVDTYAYPITTIISDNDWVGSEFDSVTFEDANYNPVNGLLGGSLDILDKLYVIEDAGTLKKFTDGNWAVANKKVLKLFFDTDGSGLRKYHHFANTEEWTQITTNLNDAITPGDHSVKLCLLYDALGNCN